MRLAVGHPFIQRPSEGVRPPRCPLTQAARSEGGGGIRPAHVPRLRDAGRAGIPRAQVLLGSWWCGHGKCCATCIVVKASGTESVLPVLRRPTPTTTPSSVSHAPGHSLRSFRHCNLRSNLLPASCRAPVQSGGAAHNQRSSNSMRRCSSSTRPHTCASCVTFGVQAATRGKSLACAGLLQGPSQACRLKCSAWTGGNQNQNRRPLVWPPAPPCAHSPQEIVQHVHCPGDEHQPEHHEEELHVASFARGLCEVGGRECELTQDICMLKACKGAVAEGDCLCEHRLLQLGF